MSPGDSDIPPLHTLNYSLCSTKSAWALWMLPWHPGRRLFSEELPYSSSRLQILALILKIPLLLLTGSPMSSSSWENLQPGIISDSAWPKPIYHEIAETSFVIINCSGDFKPNFTRPWRSGIIFLWSLSYTIFFPINSSSCLKVRNSDGSPSSFLTDLFLSAHLWSRDNPEHRNNPTTVYFCSFSSVS